MCDFHNFSHHDSQSCAGMLVSPFLLSQITHIYELETHFWPNPEMLAIFLDFSHFRWKCAIFTTFPIMIARVVLGCWYLHFYYLKLPISMNWKHIFDQIHKCWRYFWIFSILSENVWFSQLFPSWYPELCCDVGISSSIISNYPYL